MKTPKRWREIRLPAKSGSITPKQAQAAFEQVRAEGKLGTAFGLWSDYPGMPRKINNLLKPFGLRLKVKSSRDWGDQVEVSVERIDRYVVAQPRSTARGWGAGSSKKIE